MELEGKRILVTGGTGSLGKAVVRRLLSGEMGRPAQITVFSRDEAKQHYMRLSYLHRQAATDEVIYRNFQELLSFRIGDVRDYACGAARGARSRRGDPRGGLEAGADLRVFSLRGGADQHRRAAERGARHAENDTPVKTVVGISTDKACKPINVMGMTKALQERIFIEANMTAPDTRFVCVRYGNVIASRGSVVPLFLDQIAHGGPVTVTLKEMTRFLLSLDRRWIRSLPPSARHCPARPMFRTCRRRA